MYGAFYFLERKDVPLTKERGVYLITDVDSGKVYVGSTEDKTKRMSAHKRQLENNRHHNTHLQNSFNKGHQLETTFIPMDSHVDIRQVESVILHELKDKAEVFNVAMDTRAPMAGRTMPEEVREAARQRMMGNTYTLGHVQTEEHKQRAVAGRAGYAHSEETKEKLREANKGKNLDHLRTPEAMEKIRQANLGHTRNLGRTHSEESKAKMSIASTGRTHTVSEEGRERMRQAKLGKPLSEEHKQRLSEAGMGRADSEETRHKKFLANLDKAKPVVIDGVEYASRGQAAKALGVTTTTITNRLKARGEDG